MSDDPRCIKCGKPRSAHNFFGEFGYLCHNGSNTFLAEPEPPMTKDHALVQQFAAEVCRDVAELPDRTSPDDWPEAMLVTADELRAILINSIPALLSQARAEGREEAFAEAAKAARGKVIWILKGHEGRERVADRVAEAVLAKGRSTRKGSGG